MLADLFFPTPPRPQTVVDRVGIGVRRGAFEADYELRFDAVVRIEATWRGGRLVVVFRTPDVTYEVAEGGAKFEAVAWMLPRRWPGVEADWRQSVPPPPGVKRLWWIARYA